VEAALDFARAQRARHVRLDVIAGNDPAYELYTSLGFAPFASSTTLQCDAPTLAAESPLPDGYAAALTPPTKWRPFHELAHRITPGEVAVYQPATPEAFRIPASMRVVTRLINSLSGVHDRGLIVRTAGGRQIVASTSLEAHARGRGRNVCRMLLDPTHGQLAPYLVNATLSIFARLSPRNRIQCHIPHWQSALINAAESSGFRRQYDSRSLGITLRTERHSA
jgi:hypothetical protein